MRRFRKKAQVAQQHAQVKAPTESRRVCEQRTDGPQDVFRKPSMPDVIIIEDDNGDSEVENNDTETAFRRSQSHSYSSSSGHSGSESSFATYEISASSSEEDDCVVIEPNASGSGSFSNQKSLRAGKKLRPATGLPHELKRNGRSSPSDLSDCEIVLDSDGKVKQDWEEAALRRRTEKARTAESEESTSASIHANSDVKRSPKDSNRGDVRFHVRRRWEQARGAGCSSHVREKKYDGGFDQQDSNLNVPDGNDSSGEALSSQNIPPQASDANLNSGKVGVDENQLFSGVEASRRGNYTDICMDPSQYVVADGTVPSVDKIVTDRELLKETEEFRQADEEEWARRRRELQKQAEEVKREKKKRKLEAERRIEMEARQKRRLDEIRQSQLKEEQASGFKDQVRDRVQSELECIAATCRDMATLLRRLGVPVDGGAFVTDQQVTAAYKKALLRFHPDRAAALAKSDPASQVEAEEKFKLVSRMKGVLPLVSHGFFR